MVWFFVTLMVSLKSRELLEARSCIFSKLMVYKSPSLAPFHQLLIFFLDTVHIYKYSISDSPLFVSFIFSFQFLFLSRHLPNRQMHGGFGPLATLRMYDITNAPTKPSLSLSPSLPPSPSLPSWLRPSDSDFDSSNSDWSQTLIPIRVKVEAHP